MAKSKQPNSAPLLDEAAPNEATTSSLEWLVPTSSELHASDLAYPAGLHSAELLAYADKRAQVRMSQEPDPRWVAIADYVEDGLLSHTQATRQRVLVESDGRGHLCLVGLLQTALPRTTQLSGRTVEISASESLTLRSGRAGVRLRADGDIEVIGSRISVASRGLLRLVGRALRLN
jgi:hypothetical protein